MQDHFTTLHEHMGVYDANGDKVGTVGHIYQRSLVSAAPGVYPEPTGRSYLMQIDTGFLGLGRHLYIPSEAIADASNDRITLNIGKDRFDAMGWRERPDELPDEG